MSQEGMRQRSENPVRPGSQAPLALAYQPRVVPNSVDVTGLVPDHVRIDPDITIGHPGYEESGESQILPLDRFRTDQQ